MLIPLVTFIVILGLLVFVHELGHFLMAKKFGIEVEEFGFGFPPKIFGIKRGETTYTLNWIPLGGFVKIKGELGNDATDERSFSAKPAFKRVLVIVAGVIMNFAFAFVLYTIGYMAGLPQALDESQLNNPNVRDVSVVISDVAPGSAADKAGIALGDKIIALDGQKFVDLDQTEKYLASNNTKPIVFELTRANQTVNLTIQAETLNGSAQPLIGIGMIKTGIIRYNFFAAIGRGFITTLVVMQNIIFAFAFLIKSLLTTGTVGMDLSGPVGVAVLTGDVVRLGWIYVLNFAAILSVNLGIINVLPFPALDGGRLLFIIIEKIKGSPVNEKIEGLVHTIGFSLLILLLLVVTYQDIVKYGARIVGGLTSMF